MSRAALFVLPPTRRPLDLLRLQLSAKKPELELHVEVISVLPVRTKLVGHAAYFTGRVECLRDQLRGALFPDQKD
jgi:hypothetical protein